MGSFPPIQHKDFSLLGPFCALATAIAEAVKTKICLPGTATVAERPYDHTLGTALEAAVLEAWVSRLMADDIPGEQLREAIATYLAREASPLFPEVALELVPTIEMPVALEPSTVELAVTPVVAAVELSKPFELPIELKLEPLLALSEPCEPLELVTFEYVGATVAEGSAPDQAQGREQPGLSAVPQVNKSLVAASEPFEAPSVRPTVTAKAVANGLLTAEEVALKLNVTLPYVRMLCLLGKLPVAEGHSEVDFRVSQAAVKAYALSHPRLPRRPPR